MASPSANPEALSTEYNRLRAATHSLLADTGSLLTTLVAAPAADGDHQQIDIQLSRFWQLFDGLRKRHDEAQLSVAVLALTKSGKSTLLNAFIGDECLPVNNVPETARICRITHVPGAPQPIMTVGAGDSAGEHIGAAAIRDCLQRFNQQVRDHERHGPADERLLDIRAHIAGLGLATEAAAAAAAVTQQGAADGANGPPTRLSLLDTPGPNEAGEEGLRFQVERLLDSVDAVVYLLDYSKLKTAEEASVLRRLKAINPALLERLCCRLFFVVNKMDQAAESQGLDEEETRQYVAGLITRQLDCAGFTLHPDQVLLLSARDALTARLVLSGRADPDTFTRFSRIAFGAYGRRRTPAPKLGDEAVRAAAADMLECSGIVELEERVLSFLYAHSAGLKLLATMDDVGRLLQEVSNVVTACRGALERDADALVERTEALRAELAATLEDFDGVNSVTSALREEVTDELRGHLANLRSRLFTLICNALETDNINAHLASTSAAASAQASRWARIRARFVAMFAAGPSKDALSSALIDLHEDLVEQIHAEVGEFWHVMEACTNARHASLVAAINRQLEQLSARVEGAVAEQLQVRLEPVEVRLDMPSAEQFHVNLTDLIEKGIGEQQERHIRTGQRMEWVTQRHGGICRWGHYYERRVPRMRTVVETYTTTTYMLRADAIREHFIQVVDTAISTTERALAGYVREYIRLQVEAARMAIQDYGNGYLTTMGAALDTSLQGQEHRLSALAQVQGYCTRVTELRGRVAELQTAAELLVPHNSPAGLFEQVVYEGDEEAEDDEADEDYAAAASTSAAAAQATTSTATPAPASAVVVAVDTGSSHVASAAPVAAALAAPMAASSVAMALAGSVSEDDMPTLIDEAVCAGSGSDSDCEPPGLIESDGPPGLLDVIDSSSSEDESVAADAAPAADERAWWATAMHGAASSGVVHSSSQHAGADMPALVAADAASSEHACPSEGAQQQQEGTQAPGSELDRALESLSQLVQQPEQHGQDAAAPVAAAGANDAAAAAPIQEQQAQLELVPALVDSELMPALEDSDVESDESMPSLGGSELGSEISAEDEMPSLAVPSLAGSEMSSGDPMPSLGSSSCSMSDSSSMEMLAGEELDAARAAEAASMGQLLMHALPTGAAAAPGAVAAAAVPAPAVPASAAPAADAPAAAVAADAVVAPEDVSVAAEASPAPTGAAEAGNVAAQQEPVTADLVARAASLVVDVEDKIKTLQQRLEAQQLEHEQHLQQTQQQGQQEGQGPGPWVLELGNIAGAQQLSLAGPDCSIYSIAQPPQEQHEQDQEAVVLDMSNILGAQEVEQLGQQEQEDTEALLLGPDELGQLMSTLEGEAAMHGSAHQDHLPYNAAAVAGTAAGTAAAAGAAGLPGASPSTSMVSLAGSSVGAHLHVPVSRAAHGRSGSSSDPSSEYASIMAHSDAGSVHAELRSSLAMALSAAGLGDLPTPPNASPTDSDEWQLVEQEEEEAALAA